MTSSKRTIPDCHCGSPRSYAGCCGRLHGGEAACSPVELMRSRYSGYVLGLEPYLLATWHPSTRPRTLGLADADERTQWLGLKILNQHESDMESATVEFIARFRTGGGSARRLREISRFARQDGRWFYVDGAVQDG